MSRSFTEGFLGAALALSILGHLLFVASTSLGFSPFAALFGPAKELQAQPMSARISAPVAPAEMPPPVSRPAAEALKRAKRGPKVENRARGESRLAVVSSAGTNKATMDSDDPPVEAQAALHPAPKPWESEADSRAIPPEADAKSAQSASPAPVNKEPKMSALPQHATVEFEVTLESNNTKVWATQTWENRGGNYSVTFNAVAKALFWTLGSLKLESNGVIDENGLRPVVYSDERNRRKTVVTFSANEKSAYVEEHNGNRKTVPLAGQAADIMSLTYDLAFNPNIPVGTPFTLSNRDNIEELRLTEVRDEMLEMETGRQLTRFYEFRRANGSGGMQVWLALEKQWLPARIRIMGRDGAISMQATKYKLE